MVTKDNFRYEVADMLAEVKAEGDGFIFTDKAREMIKELAEYARSTDLYGHCEQMREEFLNENEITPDNVYIHLCDRIIRAPTTLHMISSAILILPILDEALDAESAIKEEQV